MKMKKLIAAFSALCVMASLFAGCSSAPASEAPSASQAVQESAAQQEDGGIFAGGSGTQEDPYQIANAEQLKAFADSVNDGSCAGYAEQYIQLTSDVDLSGVEWQPIGNMTDMEAYSTFFLGTFDGGEHTISNLKYETAESVIGAGLFGLSCGTIKNLTVENATVNVTGAQAQAIAGVVGYNMGGSVDNVSLKGESVVTGNTCTGGLIGGSQGAVTNCSVEGVTVNVIGDNDFSAGLVQCDIAECTGLLIGGGFGGSVDNCTAEGTIKAQGKEPVGIGGIGGCLEMMDSITNCTAKVTIEAENGGHAIGGIGGYAGTHSNSEIVKDTEGVVTQNYPAVIDNCTAEVKITAKDATHVGGIVGTGLYYYGEETAFKITNCKVSGEMNGVVTPGAIAGRAENSAISDCTADLTLDGEKLTDEVGKTDCMYESADQ